jgi:tRNA 2-selenouridine synthase
MAQALPADAFLSGDRPLIDVRSPGEFTRGHIPGAINLPLFTDPERAVVGTLYKQEGRDAALLEGLRITGPKLADLVEQARTLAPEGRIGVHCWRGGERSASVAWLLEKAGFREVCVLAKGYKAFRRHVQTSFVQPLRLKVVGGATGAGKTELLAELRLRGAQVVDLEALAAHKGSSFGSIGMPPQPTTEHFENLLWKALRDLDPRRTLWLEDESATIGRVKIPDSLYRQMREAHVVYMERSAVQRAKRLAVDYGSGSKEDLAAALVRIAKRIGPQHTKAALEALRNGNLEAVARIALVYYDKTYAFGLSNRSQEQITKVQADRMSTTEIADQLIQHERIETTNSEA